MHTFWQINSDYHYIHMKTDHLIHFWRDEVQTWDRLIEYNSVEETQTEYFYTVENREHIDRLIHGSRDYVSWYIDPSIRSKSDYIKSTKRNLWNLFLALCYIGVAVVVFTYFYMLNGK